MRLGLIASIVASLCLPVSGQLRGLHDSSAIGPAAGSIAADFSLPDQTGQRRTMESLMGPKGLVLVFFRSADWCIFCKGQLVQLQRDAARLRRAGLGLAAVSYDSSGVLSEFSKRKSITFPLLSDHKSEVIQTYGIADRKYPKGTQLDVEKEQAYANSIGNVPVFGLAYPSVYVVTRDRRVQWRFVSEGSELRLTGAAILEQALGGVAEESRTSVPSRNVEVTATASNASVGLGNRIGIAIELKIPKGFHVYSPEVGGEYKGVVWRMEATPCLEIGEPVYPAAEWKGMKSTGEKLPVYEETVRIKRELIVKPGIHAADPSVFKLFSKLCVDPASHITASGALTFQTCDERQCYPPQTVRPQWNFLFFPPNRQRSPDELKREFEQ